MLVSIIIPNFNKANYLKDTLNSISSQTYKNWEAIVVDDGSSDGSQTILKEFANSDPRIQLIIRNREPKGGSVCRNIGIENAIGDYMMFFDSDDLMAPECLQDRVNFITQNKIINFAVFPVGTFHKIIGDHKMVWLPKKGNHLNLFLRHDLPWNIMSPIWKTDFFKRELQSFDESFPRLQDVELHTRALLIPNVKYKIASINRPQCYYRIDPKRTNQNFFEGLSTMMAGVELYIDKFEKQLKTSNIKYQLRSTLFTFLTQNNYFLAKNLITKQDYSLINHQLLLSVKKRDIFNKSHVKIFQVYNYFYRIGFWRTKGFNYLSKFIWQAI